MMEVKIVLGASHMDVNQIHKYLCEESYWARGIAFEKVKTSIEHSCCVGAFVGEKQVGFARLVTDYATFAWLSDVYVLEEFRGRGISKSMLKELLDQEWIKSLRRVMLATKDAHKLYEVFDFKPMDKPEMFMQVLSSEFVLK